MGKEGVAYSLVTPYQKVELARIEEKISLELTTDEATHSKTRATLGHSRSKVLPWNALPRWLCHTLVVEHVFSHDSDKV